MSNEMMKQLNIRLDKEIAENTIKMLDNAYKRSAVSIKQNVGAFRTDKKTVSKHLVVSK